MKFIVTTYPGIHLKGKGIDDVDSSSVVGTIVDNIQAHPVYSRLPSSSDPSISLVLITSDSFARILDTDPMCMWYGGAEGELFRITGNTGIKYRKVVRTPSESKSKKEKNNPNKFSPASKSLYVAAYKSVMVMLSDRQGGDEASDEQKTNLVRLTASEDEIMEHFDGNNLPSLDIKNPELPLLSRRGKYMFVYFLKHDDTSLTGTPKNYDEFMYDLVQSTVESYNAIQGVQPLRAPADMDELKASPIGEKIEIIIIYNNDKNQTPVPIKTNSHIPYVTYFAAQQIPMALSRHCEQPSFLLLTPTLQQDRQELREIYTMHGITLDLSMTVEQLNLKSNSRLVYM